MKVYRTVTQTELHDIKEYSRIRFQNPFWNFKSEGKVVDIFREIENSNEKKAKDKIKIWVDAYIKSDNRIKSESNWYNIFTELSITIYLFFTNYCKSFSREKKEININKTVKDVAIIEIESDFAENSILECKDENERKYNLNKYENKKTSLLIQKENKCDLNAYIRHFQIKYKEKCSYDSIFKEFKDERVLFELLRTTSSKYDWQKEERFFINIDTKQVLPTKGLGSLGEYKRMKKSEQSDREDFIEAMYIQFSITYSEILKKFPKYIYIYLKKEDIKIHYI